jgi:uncharacterized protein YebE (UPF0316 family)
MWIQLIILVFIGIIEELVAILYYKSCEKGFKYACGLFQILRVFIWYYVLRIVVENIDNLWLILFYSCGGAIGDYISLSIEPHIEKRFLWIHKLFKRKKGRKKKEKFLFQSKK